METQQNEQQINVTVRYSDEDLREFKTLIDEKLEKASQELAFTQSQIKEANESNASQQSGDWTDESSNHTEMELLTSMMARQQHFIQSLESALIRIQNKSYGICTVTGQLIDKILDNRLQTQIRFLTIPIRF